MKKQSNSQRGFTIIELMIATAVLSTILILVTVLMINVGKLYYKGINQARVQDGVRAIADDVTGQLKLNDSPPAPGSTTIGGVSVSAYCISTTRYSYVLDTQIGQKQYNSNSSSPQFPHILWRDTIPSGSACAPAELENSNPSAAVNSGDVAGTGGTEMIPPGSRLTAFSISSASPFTVLVGVAYGADDLLNHSGINTRCLGNVGDQFCATASLTTSVTQRLQ